MTKRNQKFIFIGFLFGLMFILAGPLLYSQQEEDVTSDSSPRNIGGLLFDVDDGIELEQGGGGSVYVRSNKEYMQKKFRSIDRQFNELESRIESLEQKLLASQLDTENDEEKSKDPAELSQTPEGRRVLSTL